MNSLFVFFGSTNWHQTNLLAAKFDLKLIAGLQTQQRGVGLTHQQVAVALNRGHIAELAAALAGAAATTAKASTASTAALTTTGCSSHTT